MGVLLGSGGYRGPSTFFPFFFRTLMAYRVLFARMRRYSSMLCARSAA